MILILAAAFLLIISIIFSGNNVPKIFSHRIYLVETDAFSLVKEGSALITEQAETENIAPGNIIIFSDDSDAARIGEVREAKLEDGVYTFVIRNDIDEEMTIGQSHILGKGMYYSEIIGWLISFALSPAGVCLIAVLPCAAFIVFEIISSVKRNERQSEFETVKKQDEIPTYLPPRQQDYIPPEERPAFSYERDRLMEEAGLFSPPQKKAPTRQEERVPISERDIDKLIKETRAKHLVGSTGDRQQERFERPEYSDYIEYTEPQEQMPQGGGQFESRGMHDSRNTDDFSYRDYPPDYRSPQFRQAPPMQEPPRPIIIDEDETRNIFEHSFEDRTVESSQQLERQSSEEPAHKASRRPRGERNKNDDVKRYEPPKRNPPKLAPRVSRLDSLLQEESADSYDIDDILKSIENNK